MVAAAAVAAVMTSLPKRLLMPYVLLSSEPPRQQAPTGSHALWRLPQLPSAGGLGACVKKLQEEVGLGC
jgi:hypothetical protein